MHDQELQLVQTGSDMVAVGVGQHRVLAQDVHELDVAAVGVLFFFFAWFLAGIVLPGQEALGAVYKLLVTSFAGALGGVIGVGMS